MRADAHYIDQLDAPPVPAVQSISIRSIDGADGVEASGSLLDSIKRHGVLEPLLVHKRERRYRVISGHRRLAAARGLNLSELPCMVVHVSDDEAGRIAATALSTGRQTAGADDCARATFENELSRSLSAILRCTPLLADSLPALTRTVAIDMVTAEVQRALTGLTSSRAARQQSPRPPGAVQLREVVQRIVEHVAPELRLRQIAIDTRVQTDAMARVDVELLAATVASVILLLSSAHATGKGARLLVSLTAAASDEVTLALEQEAVVLPDAWLMSTSTTAPGAVAPELTPLAALERVAQSYGGRVVTSRLPRASRVAIVLPISE
jgi:ParB/RepB/Spo0J family partition protein